MSFKSFSSAHTVPAKDKSDDKVKAAPANDPSPPKSDKTPDKDAPASET